MGGITESLFGGSTQESITTPQIIPRLPAISAGARTGAGSTFQFDPFIPRVPGKDKLRGVSGNITLAPEIGQIRGETLGGIRSLIGDVQGDISTLRGLENPFVQARVQPFIAQQDRARRDAIRRGVAGPLTSLATNPFTSQIAEQGALATAESQQLIRQSQELVRGLLSDVSGQGRQLLEEELELLGLGQQQIRDIINSQLAQPTSATTVSEQSQSPGIGGLFNSFFPGGLVQSGTVF